MMRWSGNWQNEVADAMILKGGAQLMAYLNWSQCPAVESIPGKVSGAWVLRGTRMPVSAIFENIEAGANTSGWHDRMARRGHGCGRIGVMKRPFSATVWREGDWFVSQCLDVELASQGRSAEEALANLREAIELHYEPPMATHPPAVWPIEARPHVQLIVDAVNATTPGSFIEVEIPFR